MLRGTAFTRQMKEDILRRMAEQSDSEDELEAELKDRIRQGGAFAEEDSDSGLDESVKVKVAGDGEESGSDEDEQGGVVEEVRLRNSAFMMNWRINPELTTFFHRSKLQKQSSSLRTFGTPTYSIVTRQQGVQSHVWSLELRPGGPTSR